MFFCSSGVAVLPLLVFWIDWSRFRFFSSILNPLACDCDDDSGAGLGKRSVMNCGNWNDNTAGANASTTHSDDDVDDDELVLQRRRAQK